MHLEYGVPQLQHDQMKTISKHIQKIKNNSLSRQDTNNQKKSQIKKLTRKQLKECDKWPRWIKLDIHNLTNMKHKSHSAHRANYHLMPMFSIFFGHIHTKSTRNGIKHNVYVIDHQTDVGQLF